MEELVRLALRRPGATLLVILVACGLYFGQSMFYTVAADEEAVVQRFGKYDRTAGPGLRFKLPAFIEEYTKVPVKAVQTMEFGFRTAKAGQRTQYHEPTPDDQVMARMLTGDLSLAHVEWTVLYKIHDAKAYLFNVGGEARTQTANIEGVIHDVAENIMRRKVGDISIDEALTTGREAIGAGAKPEMQAKLDAIGAGVEIVRVDVQQAQPPEKVVDAWDSVNRARQDKERIINEANGERNSVVPAARGERDRAIREAQGYALRVVETATGKAEAFKVQAAEYKKAPEVTRTRIYIEAMQQVLGGAEVTVIDGALMDNALPLIDLNGGSNPLIKKGGE